MPEPTIKEFLKIFKAAAWKSPAELQSIMHLVPGNIDPRSFDEMIEVACTKKLAAEFNQHQGRLQILKQVLAKTNDKAFFVPLIKALKTGDAKVRALAVAHLAKVNNPEEHPKLIALLKATEPEVRLAATQVLKEVAGKSILPSLTKLIEEKDFPGRSEALDIVMPIAGHHALGILKTTLEIGRPNEKTKALKYLGDAQYMAKMATAALRTIALALEDPNEQVVSLAITSFAALCSEDDYFEFLAAFLDSDNPHYVKGAVVGLRRFRSPRVIAALERKIRSGPNNIRTEALNTIEAIGNDEVLPVLVDGLSHKLLAVRNQAKDILSRLSQAKKIDVARTIIWLLHSRDVNVRRMAVEIARSVSDTEGELWPKLLDFLRDEDWWVRERVMDALVELAGQQLTPHMVALLQDPQDVVRRFAVDVLIRLNDAKALGALINTAREDRDWWAREKAIEGIASFKDERAVPYIVDLMRRDTEVQFVCLEALKTLKARSTAPYVAELLASPDSDIRIFAMKCLGEFDATEHAPRIQPMLADQDPTVARAAQELLLRWNVALSSDYTASRDKAVSFLDRMLTAVLEADADDLILASGRPPYMKRMGKTAAISQSVLSHDQITTILTPHLSLGQMEELQKLHDVDFSYEVISKGTRFRANIFQQETGLGAVFRCIKGNLPALEDLGLPPIVRTFGDLRYGLVLVGGPTGSGKSTTLGALIDYINRTSDRHVIALEDPIEVVHDSKKGLVNQREIGTHTKSFQAALRSTLREDPDVILVGEMRDLITISFAVSAAETGHLVFGTVHTVSADSSIDRLINAFPGREQPQVRTTLAENLRAVICQYLVKRQNGPGRVLTCEVMMNTDAVAHLIRKGKTFQIPSVVATSRDIGMQSMDSELLRLFRAGVISADDAYMRANTKKDFEEIIGDKAQKAKEGEGEKGGAAGSAAAGQTKGAAGQAAS